MSVLMKRFLVFILIFKTIFLAAQPATRHNLAFDHLADRWDEAIPLGNGMLGALIWQKNNQLRLSLDRADLWDERKALDLTKFDFKWVEQQVKKKDYSPVQKLGDHPYDQVAYPTKLPAAAMEFDVSKFGKVVSNTLDISTALNTVKFESGVIFKSYIHATEHYGVFSFENLPESKTASAVPEMIIHNYNSGKSAAEIDDSHAGQGLEKLGYRKGALDKAAQRIHYKQPTYDNHYYEVLVTWRKVGGNKMEGRWTITNDKPAELTRSASGWETHLAWWKKFWAQSSVSIPEASLEKQYYLENYKLGCTARAGAPAITLQAVWTADNGSLPPWKGDFHNDLNTQLSYWPAYTGNHLQEGATFTDWLWKIRKNNIKYTKQYFGVDGLNVPGVVTLNGDPMGGWIQYSLSPTVSAWCAQHFYWQWKYAMDEHFLKDRAYPYIHEAATYLENITRLESGVRKLPLSSSPEYNNNRIDAWFKDWSNFDLSLATYLFSIAGEVATAVGMKREALHWQQILSQLPGYEINETGFTVAPGQNLNESHRHMSQYMAIYPLAMLDINEQNNKAAIENSLKRIEEKGTRAWCGYSFSWMASLYARAYKADSAVKHLKIFASNFCSPNSFHLNGDQKGGQYSDATYRPFTLEGNFAFAQGIHELLLQSRKGYLQVFPAIPDSWRNVSFSNLRGEGAFLISAEKKNGATRSVSVKAEKASLLKIKLPFTNWKMEGSKVETKSADREGIVSLAMQKGQAIIFKNVAN
jgi:alpha-L-fucosidase 2